MKRSLSSLNNRDLLANVKPVSAESFSSKLASMLQRKAAAASTLNILGGSENP
jgi:hypothetical protein